MGLKQHLWENTLSMKCTVLTAFKCAVPSCEVRPRYWATEVRSFAPGKPTLVAKLS